MEMNRIDEMIANPNYYYDDEPLRPAQTLPLSLTCTSSQRSRHSASSRPTDTAAPGVYGWKDIGDTTGS